jgi:hypothetical protein
MRVVATSPVPVTTDGDAMEVEEGDAATTIFQAPSVVVGGGPTAREAAFQAIRGLAPV